MDKSSQSQDFELLTEIAIAYYCDEVTQEEIANRFGFSRIKVGRLLKRAKEEGIVEITRFSAPSSKSKCRNAFPSAAR